MIVYKYRAVPLERLLECIRCCIIEQTSIVILPYYLGPSVSRAIEESIQSRREPALWVCQKP